MSAITALSQPILTPITVSREQRVYRAFSAKPLANSVLFWFFATLIDESKKHRKIETVAASILKHADLLERKLETLTVWAKFQDLSGLQLGDCFVCIKLAREAALEFFELREKSNAIKPAEFIFERVGAKQSQYPVAFSDEQLHLFGITRKEITQDPLSLSCYAYALLYVGELEAKNFIFHKDKVIGLLKLFDLLGRWNYVSVSKPDKGDLVVYTTVNGKAQHMAIFIEDQLVHSKPGDFTQYAYDHKLFDVFPSYGNQVIFFRKGPGLS